MDGYQRLGVFICVCFLTFWFSVGYVIFHFVDKFW